MQSKIINIRGLHCRSCEIVTERNISKIKAVEKATVDRKKGTAVIYYNGQISDTEIEKAVNDAGYQIGREEKTYLSKDKKSYKELIIAILFAFIVLYILSETKILDFAIASKNGYSNLFVVFLIGITAGLSTCMALVGGLVLGVASKFSQEHPEASPLKKLQPHIYFNLGRIISFFILGGLIGFAGSLFQLSAQMLAILIILVSAIMLILGLQLINIFPKLSSFTFALPKKFSKINSNNAAILGALTFFLPCGFTQSMQAYAIASQNPVTASLTMGIFAIGTTPGLLGIGALTSFAKGEWGRIFFKFAGIVVVLMAIFNISNALKLTGLNFSNKTSINAPVENNLQIIKMTQKPNGYEPSVFTIKKGIPVKWIITSESNNSCASYIIVPDLKIKQILNLGENVFEFTPTKIGKITFSCAMGMYSGYFNVID